MAKDKEKTKPAAPIPDESPEGKPSQSKPHKDMEREAIKFLGERLTRLEERFKQLAIYLHQTRGKTF